MTNSDYILFLDESSVTRTNPYLLLGGIIISRNDYKKVLIPSIQDTKSILGKSSNFLLLSSIITLLYLLFFGILL